MYNKRILLFGIIFFIMNLAFIPLLSLYGLRVCPVLEPLGFIKGYASRIKKLIEKGELQPEQILKSAQSIDEMIIRQNKIIEGIREFTHSSDRAAFKTVSLNDLFKLVLEMTALKAEEFRVTITINDPDSKIAVSGNMIQLSQVFINLCSNAIDAIAELPEKWIKIVINNQNDLATIDIIDSGTGIPPHIASQLFHKNLTTKSLEKGTGLGLKLCKRIIEAQGENIYRRYRTKYNI